MAGPNDPTPPATSTTPAQAPPNPAVAAGVRDQTQAVKEATAAWEALPEAQKKAYVQTQLNASAQDSLTKNTNLGTAATNAYKTAQDYLTSSVRGLGSSLQSLRQNTSNITDGFDAAGAKVAYLYTLLNNNKVFSGFSISAGAATNTVRQQFDDLSEASGGFEGAIKQLGVSGNPIFSKLVGMTKDAALSFLDSASSAEKLEQSYLNMLGATGRLNTVFSKTGELQDSLKDGAARYSETIALAARSTGQSTARIAELSVALGSIPGGLDGVSKTTNLDKLTSATRLAGGAMRSTADVVSAVKLAYDDLSAANGKVTDATERGERMFSLMASTSQTLGLRFEDTQGFISKVAAEFKNIGDNTEGATRILTRFQGALQATGLTASASTAIVSNMVTAVGKLSTGTAALVSQRSGGPGGLQGAFQIENLIREGKIDQVAQMTERAIRQQFGGRIVTQAEAGTSQQAAARFQQQRSLIQSGAFGKLASNDQDASRLLEALSKGTSATAEFITGQQAADSLEKQGLSLQQQQTTILQEIATSLRQTQMAGERGIDTTVKNTIGVNNPQVRDSLNESRMLTEQRGRENQKNNFNAEQTSLNQVREGVTGVVEGVRVASIAVKDLFKNLVDDVEGIVASTVENRKTAANQTDARANGSEIRRSPRPVTLNGAVAPAVKSAQDNQPIKVDSTSNVNLTISVPDGLNVETQSTDGVKVSINQQNNNFALNNYSIG